MANSLWTMPIIILNMGGEMIYILHQRLQAQTVQDEKAKKVLGDVVRAMFSAQFIAELFKPQEMYSSVSTKQIFEKLAHSSIMRLNKSSMEKLFDLMSMGFKHQVMSLSCPEQLLHITLNHMESIKRLVGNDIEGLTGLIDSTIDSVIKLFSVLPKLDWQMLRLCIMRFLQGKKIKVSLFLQQNMQTLDGVLVLKTVGTMGYGVEQPGTIRYYEGNSAIRTQNVSMGDFQDKHTVCNELIDVTSPLGMNLYSKASITEAASSLSHRQSSLTALKAMHNFRRGGSGGGEGVSSSAARMPLSPARSSMQSSAKAELNMLSDLLGFGSGAGGSKGASTEAKPFKINLFPDNNFEDKQDSKQTGGNYSMIEIDATADCKGMAAYMDELDLNDRDASFKADGKADDDDDLLALMDSAAK